MTETQEIIYTGAEGIFARWKVARRSRVGPDTVLFTYKVGSEERKFLNPEAVGVVQRLGALKAGITLQKGDIVVVVEKRPEVNEPCTHDTVIKDMCADCGIDLREKDGRPGERVVQAEGRIAMIHNIPELHVSAKAALDQGWEDIQMLLSKRKLCLLVDLDLTLVHTTHRPDNPAQLASENVIKYQLRFGSRNHYDTRWYYTKVRPATRDFLKKMADLFELHIFTLSDRPYAHKIAKILDPDGALFGTRILSRDECFTKDKKTANVRALFPRGDNLVCIIDDRDDVWQHHESGKPAENLIKVKPYCYFTETGDIHAPQRHVSPPNSTSKVEVREESKPMVKNEAQSAEDCDDYLLYLEETLRRIHKTFYDRYDNSDKMAGPPHTNIIMAYLRQKVLAGCRLVFSGVFSSGARDQERKEELYRRTQMFGAKIYDEIIPRDKNPNDFTTHVIVDKVWGTKKITEALGLVDQLYIVKIEWLLDSLDRWERINELLYVVSDENGRQMLANGEMILIKAISSSASNAKLMGKNKEESSNGKTSEITKVPSVVCITECVSDNEMDIVVGENVDGLISQRKSTIELRADPQEVTSELMNADGSEENDSDVQLDSNSDAADEDDDDVSLMASNLEQLIAESSSTDATTQFQYE